MDGSPLEVLAADRKRLRDALRRNSAQLKEAVLAAVAAGVPEAVVARRAGVDRMTVRDWSGKREPKAGRW